MMKKLLILAAIAAISCSTQPEKDTYSQPLNYDVVIPMAGNSWILRDDQYISSEMLTDKGVMGWVNKDETIRTFFYVDSIAKISLGIRCRVKSASSELEVSVNGLSKKINLTGSEFTDVYIGNFKVDSPGYQYVEIKGLTREGNSFAELSDILLKLESPEAVKFVKDDFYFGRRGPSDHLNYVIADSIENLEWFYSEVLIPDQQDVIGSYFMANGFAEGYFGIQVNSPNERRILFSVWSPYNTNNPDDVPEEYKIKLLKKGENVITNQFGNEGSGGQSYKVFNWQTNVRYGFLVGAKPSTAGYTDYIAYFFDPVADKWQLIAQFRRPKTVTYLKRLYSFLENFIPDQGVVSRKGLYQNQWVFNSSGWHELTKALFTADNTARKDYRLDYSGGQEGHGFYLKNCGFTNDRTAIGTLIQRPGSGSPPKIDFTALE